MRTALHWLAVLGLSSCTLSQNFHQCDSDSGCPMTADGRKQFCTSDHLCAVGTPDDKLCTQTYPATPPPGAVPIGVLLRLPASGSGVSDQLRLQAVELGIDEVNKLSGSGQRSLVAHICDVSATSDDPLKAMKKVIHEQGAVAVIGPSTSQAVIDVSAEAGTSQVPLVSPSATAAAISSLPQKGFIFRVAPSDNQQGPVLAKLVPGGGMNQNLALIFVNDTYGQGLQASFAGAWQAMDPANNKPGLTFSFDAGNTGQLNMIPQVVVAKAPTFVLAIASADAATVLDQLSGLPTNAMDPSKSVPILMTDGAKKAALLNLVNQYKAQGKSLDHFRRVKGTAPTVDVSGNYVIFSDAFKGRFMGIDPSSDAFAAYTYDAFYAVAIAIGSLRDQPTGPAVAAALQRFNGSKAQATVGSAGFLDAVNKLTAGSGVTLNGASGTIRFTAAGDRDTGLFEEWSIDVNNVAFVSTPL